MWKCIRTRASNDGQSMAGKALINWRKHISQSAFFAPCGFCRACVCSFDTFFFLSFFSFLFGHLLSLYKGQQQRKSTDDRWWMEMGSKANMQFDDSPQMFNVSTFFSFLSIIRLTQCVWNASFLTLNEQFCSTPTEFLITVMLLAFYFHNVFTSLLCSPLRAFKGHFIQKVGSSCLPTMNN